MKSDRDCTFHPRLESLEDRFLLTGGIIFRTAAPASFPLPTIFVTGGTHTAAQVPTLLHPAQSVSHTVSIVPHHISLGLFDTPSPTTVSGFDTGISRSAIRTPAVLAGDTGFALSGLPNYAPSQPLTAPPLLPVGFTLSPDGTVNGRLF